MIVVVKNECSLLGLGTLKSAISQEWINKMSWVFACWDKFRKAKSYFNDYWVGMVKNGQDPIDNMGLLNQAYLNWFDELIRLMEWFLACW